MEHTLPVGVVERLGGFGGNAHRLLDRQLSFAGDPVPQRLPVHEWHGEPEMPGGFPRVEHGEDMGVLQAGSHFHFAVETLGPQDVGQLLVQHLERHRALVLEILGQEDGGHATAPELALDGVSRKCGLQRAGEVAQSRVPD